MPDLPAASMKLATEPPAVDAPGAARPEAARTADDGGIKMPDLPAMSRTLATQPPQVEAAQPPSAPAASADAGATKLPDLPAASAAIASQPPTVTTETKPAAMHPAAAQPAAETAHVIVAGDNYWNLAKTLYGDPALWPKISRANPTLRARALPVGATLKIPAK
jgi:5'-nucleotidase